MQRSDPFSSENGVYLIAEIGGNHEGDFEYARRLTYLAAESGVDAIKFQIYRADTLVNPHYDADRFEHFKKFELAPEQHIELAQICRARGKRYMASVWDPGAFEYIDPYMEIYKVGSGDLTAHDFIERIVRTGKPMILSTGVSGIDDIRKTLNVIAGIDETYIVDEKVALLQCTSLYPATFDDVNLNVMTRLRSEFGLPVGYSDHTEGMLAVEVAVAMGAQIIEVHFTDDRAGKTFRDHKVSATKEEIKAFLDKVKVIRRIQGSDIKEPTENEIRSNHITSFRRGLFVNRAIRKGELVPRDALVTLRPRVGLGADKFHEVIGAEACSDIEPFVALGEEEFEKKNRE